jgi:hypothetical protein
VRGIEREEREEPASHSNRLIERERSSLLLDAMAPGRAGTEQPEREPKIGEGIGEIGCGK